MDAGPVKKRTAKQRQAEEDRLKSEDDRRGINEIGVMLGLAPPCPAAAAVNALEAALRGHEEARRDVLRLAGQVSDAGVRAKKSQAEADLLNRKLERVKRRLKKANRR